MITVSCALEQDLEEIAALEQDIFSDAWSLKAIQESMAQEYVTILVARDMVPGRTGTEPANQIQTISGYLICYRMINEGNIARIAVAPDARRQGIGRSLMQGLLDLGESLGLTEYSLEVRAANEPAIALYRTFAFAEEGRRRNYYSAPVEDALIMWRR